jgi:NodT family efflux transporter outer membrane factor (OMF) lipoprotein
MTVLMRFYAPVLILLLASGCMVGPDYKQPRVAMNGGWSQADDARVANDAQVEIAWWHTFDDATLNLLVEVAYHQNITLQVVGLRIIEARAQLGIAEADLLPQNVNPIASAAAVGVSDHAANSALGDHSYGTYRVGFDATWEPDFWGKFRRGVRAANASYRATIADYDDALVSLSADVAQSYVVIRTIETLLELAHRNLDVQQEGLDIAESRFRNGANTGLDVSQAKNLLETTKASIPKLESDLVHAENALSTLLGQPTGAIQTLLAASRGIPAMPAKVALGVPADLLRRRPDIRAVEYRAIAQCDQIGVAKADLLPRLVLFGELGTVTSTGGGTFSNNSTLGNLFGPNSAAYNAGGGVFWPILHYPQIINNIRVQDARYEELLLEYVQTVLKAAQEVEDGLTGYLKHRDAAGLEEGAVTAAREAVQLALTQYREGAVDYQRVLDTQRQLLESENKLTDFRSIAATNLIALYKALGGGWQVRLGDPTVTESARLEMESRTSWGSTMSQPAKGK